jgi:hypothetical protein
MPDVPRLLRRLRRLGRQLRRRGSLPNVVAGVWSFVALSRLRRELPGLGTSATVLAPPRILVAGLPGVYAVLRRRKATCLERSLVLQRWLASQGRPTEVVIGVSAPGEAFAAHAWLADYGFDPESIRYKELMRLPPPTDRRGIPTPGGGFQSGPRRWRRRTRLSR